jgi:S-disulfanyl-L-cysteine oxidoreductase SoxD
MCNWPSAAALLLALVAAKAWAQYPGIGRDATPKEVAAWDIDVRPDFKGLPNGSGSVAKGMEVWESKCASCHGVFGESNEVFMPIVGGTTKDDMRSGRVARLTDSGYPQRTTLMKLSTVSTLWDYINRAMPWTQPKSLSTEEVYAVTAYVLNLGGIVPDSFVLSDKNMPDVQNLLLNRNGKTTNHALWPGRPMGSGARPDVKAAACMKDCATEPKVASLLPDFARNAHGNLAEQNRLIGAQRGMATGPSSVAATTSSAFTLAQQHSCTACHGADTQLLGPSFKDIAVKQGSRVDARAYLAGKIMAGGQGVWGTVAMPAQAIAEADANAIAQWLALGANR